MSRKASYKISVGGADITMRLSPHLQSLSIQDNEGTDSDTCDIELNDQNGQILLPSVGDPLIATLGWQGEGGSVVFEGTIDEVTSRGGSSGRVLQISAKGVDTMSKAKEPQQKNMDKKTVKEALNEAGKAAGITVEVDKEFADDKRDWWGMNDESFLGFGERLAREYGGIFKVQGKKAILANKEGNSSVSGATLSSVTAAWGRNLIDWRISPTRGRPQAANVKSRHYDTKEAKWKTEKEKVDGSQAQGDHADRYSRHDKKRAGFSAKNGKKDSKRGKGGGNVTIDGNAAARPGGICIVSGARPGIDGPYKIKTVNHDIDASGGWKTKITFHTPGEGTGQDNRGNRSNRQ